MYFRSSAAKSREKIAAKSMYLDKILKRALSLVNKTILAVLKRLILRFKLAKDFI